MLHTTQLYAEHSMYGTMLPQCFGTFWLLVRFARRNMKQLKNSIKKSDTLLEIASQSYCELHLPDSYYQ